MTKEQDQQRPQQPTSRIPEFRSREEEAAFWDTHDFTEFEDELEEITYHQFVPAYVKNSVTAQLDQATLAGLAERAFAQEIGVSTLIRKWILKRLQYEATPAADTR